MSLRSYLLIVSLPLTSCSPMFSLFTSPIVQYAFQNISDFIPLTRSNHPLLTVKPGKTSFSFYIKQCFCIYQDNNFCHWKVFSYYLFNSINQDFLCLQYPHSCISVFPVHISSNSWVVFPSHHLIVFPLNSQPLCVLKYLITARLLSFFVSFNISTSLFCWQFIFTVI